MWKVIQDQNIQDISLKCDICGKNVKNGHNLGDHFTWSMWLILTVIVEDVQKYSNICTTSGSIMTIPMQMMCIYLWKQEQIKGTRGMEAQVFIVQASIRNKLFLNLTNFVHKKLFKPLWILDYYGHSYVVRPLFWKQILKSVKTTLS